MGMLAFKYRQQAHDIFLSFPEYSELLHSVGLSFSVTFKGETRFAENCFKLGKYYLDGKVCPKNSRLAEECFALALNAEYGMVEARELLESLVNEFSPDLHFALLVRSHREENVGWLWDAESWLSQKWRSESHFQDPAFPSPEHERKYLSEEEVRSMIKRIREESLGRVLSWAIRRLDSPMIQYELAETYDRRGEREEAIKWLVKAAQEHGHIESMHDLINSFERKEDEKAFYWWIKLIHQAHVDNKEIDLDPNYFCSHLIKKYSPYKEIFPFYIEYENGFKEKGLTQWPRLIVEFNKKWKDRFEWEAEEARKIFLSIEIDKKEKGACQLYEWKRQLLVSEGRYPEAMETALTLVELVDDHYVKQCLSDFREDEGPREAVLRYASFDIIDIFSKMTQTERANSKWWNHITGSPHPENFNEFIGILCCDPQYSVFLEELSEAQIFNLCEVTDTLSLYKGFPIRMLVEKLRETSNPKEEEQLLKIIRLRLKRDCSGEDDCFTISWYLGRHSWEIAERWFEELSVLCLLSYYHLDPEFLEVIIESKNPRVLDLLEDYRAVMGI